MKMDAPFPNGMVEAWGKFLAGDHDLIDLFREGLLFPLQRQAEMARMIELASKINPVTVFEVGADKGGGLFAWCKLPSVRNIAACEIRGTPYKYLFQSAFPMIDFLWLDGSSYDPSTVKQVSEWDNPIDVLFLDGDKSSFVTDFDCYRKMMSPKGIVFMHDIQDEAPRRAFLEVAARGYDHMEIIDTTESDLAVGRQSAGQVSASAHESWLRYWAGASAGVGVIFTGGR